jgi:hypothetical protein
MVMKSPNIVYLGKITLLVALGVSACVYSYYVSQVSLTRSLFDAYRLVWLLFPIVTTAAIGWLSARLTRERTAS